MLHDGGAPRNAQRIPLFERARSFVKQPEIPGLVSLDFANENDD